MSLSIDPGFDRLNLVDIFGPLVKLPDATSIGEEYAVIRSIIPPSTIVPLHSHPDRETIVVIAGRLGVWLHGSWSEHGAGEVVDLPSNEKHALRNDSGGEVHVVLVTTGRMAGFFREISAPVGTGVSPERLAHFLATAHEYGYWNGSPQEQAEIGVAMPDSGASPSP